MKKLRKRVRKRGPRPFAKQQERVNNRVKEIPHQSKFQDYESDVIEHKVHQIRRLVHEWGTHDSIRARQLRIGAKAFSQHIINGKAKVVGEHIRRIGDGLSAGRTPTQMPKHDGK